MRCLHPSACSRPTTDVTHQRAVAVHGAAAADGNVMESDGGDSQWLKEVMTSLKEEASGGVGGDLPDNVVLVGSPERLMSVDDVTDAFVRSQDNTSLQHSS
jgi:hypothetical protein